MELRERRDDIKNPHALSFGLCFYDTWHIPRSIGFDVNTLFLSGKISWSFPLNNRFSFYLADSFLLMHSRPDRETGADFPPDITRWYNNAQVGIKILL